MRDAGFASGDLDLLFRVINSRYVGEEQSSSRAALVFDNHAKHSRIQFLHHLSGSG